jgi:hypothetical protein
MCFNKGAQNFKWNGDECWFTIVDYIKGIDYSRFDETNIDFSRKLSYNKIEDFDELFRKQKQNICCLLMRKVPKKCHVLIEYPLIKNTFHVKK